MFEHGVLILVGTIFMMLIVADGLRRRRKNHDIVLNEQEATPEVPPAELIKDDEQLMLDAQEDLPSEPLVHGVGTAKILSAGCHIGSATSVRGHLIAGESVIIKGYIQGSVVADDQRVHLASGAHVTASIKGGQVTVDGKVEGDIHATQRLALLQKADVLGDVTTARFDCLSGAKLHGRVKANSAVG